jgi:hypothetical protein
MCLTPDFHFVIDLLRGVFEVLDFLLFKLFLLILAGIGVVAVIRHHLKKQECNRRNVKHLHRRRHTLR